VLARRIRRVGNEWNKSELGHAKSKLSGNTIRLGRVLVSMSYHDGVPRKTRLSRTMSLEQFDNGYWYASELAAFAEQLGVPHSGQLRKNELEVAVKRVLRTGEVSAAAGRPRLIGTRDVERGLALDLRVAVYTNDRATKDFLEREAARMAVGYMRRSGARYRLNRWREDQLARGVVITYRDLVAEYVRLSTSRQPFVKIPHGRYINFLAEYLANEPGATHAAARAAWKRLKRLDVPKDYASWVSHRKSRRGRADGRRAHPK
jgi:hypothetical protein